ncbi:uncharacterized protein [Anolis sagrei]|uniref:uncharacterized protein n=1 Tax=Anolis sagrei TaxID=38937 RepID=UPI00351FD8DF
MPRKKIHRSLQRLCLENIAANMQCVWAKDYTDKYLDEYQFRYIQGPFSELAGSLVQELIQLLGKRVTRAMLHLLLVPHLTELRLAPCPKLVSNTITQMVTVRCKNLTSLDLDGCSRVPTDALVDLVEGLPGLTRLILSGTQCNTQVLSAVGSTCRRLRELNVSECKKLSPASLFHLVYDPTASAFCCSTLQNLNVDGMQSSPRCDDLPWALAYMLLALPNLIVLQSETTTDAVCLIHDRNFRGAQVPAGFPSMPELVKRWDSLHPSGPRSQLKLPLKEILDVPESSLSIILAVCPHMANATVVLEEHSCLARRLLPWGSLTSLSLECWLRRLEELLPVTARLGTQLETLSLEGFSFDDEVSLHVLLSHCPNLKSFFASLDHLVKGSPSEEALAQVASLPPLAFPQLEEFHLTFSDLLDSKDPPETLGLAASLVSLLKGSPRLEYVMLFGLPFSLDGVFEEVLGAPGTTAALLHLIDLSMVECKVSSGTIHRILSLENPLRSLVLDRCPDIYRKDYEALLRRVSREDLELRITWK